MSFPLYDRFINDGKEDEMPPEMKKSIVADIAKLDENGQELLYSLVRYYGIMNNSESLFGGKILKKGIKFDLELFPNPLKYMVKSFVNKHLNDGDMNEKKDDGDELVLED